MFTKLDNNCPSCETYILISESQITSVVYPSYCCDVLLLLRLELEFCATWSLGYDQGLQIFLWNDMTTRETCNPVLGQVRQ